MASGGRPGYSTPAEHAHTHSEFPFAWFARLFHFKESFAGVPVVQIPTAVRAAFRSQYIDGITKPLVFFCPAILKIIQRRQDVIMPARREREVQYLRIDYLICLDCLE
jgi:hypothetical protein